MGLLQQILAQLYLRSKFLVAEVRPAVNAWIVKASVLELSTIDRRFRPLLVVGMASRSLALYSLIKGLHPLEHLHAPAQTV